MVWNDPLYTWCLFGGNKSKREKSKEQKYAACIVWLTGELSSKQKKSKLKKKNLKFSNLIATLNKNVLIEQVQTIQMSLSLKL